MYQKDYYKYITPPSNNNTATINLFQVLRNDGHPYKGKYNHPRQNIDKFRKELIKSKITFTETNNNNSTTFNWS